jgi:hypothetical protein
MQYIHRVEYYSPWRTRIQSLLVIGKRSCNAEEKKVKNTGDKVRVSYNLELHYFITMMRIYIRQKWQQQKQCVRKKCLKSNGNSLLKKLIVGLHVYQISMSHQGPLLLFPPCPMPSDFYKKMLPDSFFNHIAECTNLRAQRHFANIHTKNDKSWCEVR